MPDLLENCELQQLRSVLDPNGLLVVNAQLARPFEVKRVFTVSASKGALRGQHAHRGCSQFLVAPAGPIIVKVRDGRSSREYALDRPTVGLLIPPLVWASQYFSTDASLLLVLCDEEYQEDDYIRDWDRYLELVGLPNASLA